MTNPFLMILGLMLLSLPAHAAEERMARERLIERKRETTTADKATLNRPGDHELSLPHGGLVRKFRVHVPPGYDPARPAPLVIALHGGGGDMDYMARDEYYGLTSQSDREGFIAVFPNGYSKFRSGKFATWNAGACCGDARDKNIDDVGFIKNMIGFLDSRLRIDRNRIFATGMSNGGLMAYRLACEMPETIAAIAPVAGTDNTLACPPGRPVSVLHIHAKNDTHVLFEGGAGEDSFRDISKVTSFTSVPETVERWIARNRCAAAPRRVLSVPGAYCDLYAPCADGSAVKLCVTEDGGHSWPGGYKPRGKEKASQIISANDIMWDFFKGLK